MSNNEVSQKRKRGNSAVIPEEATVIENAGPRSFEGVKI